MSTNNWTPEPWGEHTFGIVGKLGRPETVRWELPEADYKRAIATVGALADRDPVALTDFEAAFLACLWFVQTHTGNGASPDFTVPNEDPEVIRQHAERALAAFKKVPRGA